MPVQPQLICPSIEWEFDLRARHPEHTEYKTRWRKESAATRSQLKCIVDVSCGSHTDMTFDIFPSGTSPGPCFIYLHGGFWRSSDKSESSFVANTFSCFGITTIIMNYKLAPAVSVTDIVTEVQLSVASIFDRARLFGIDNDRIHIGGFSAGGLLAASVLGTDWTAFGISKPAVQSGMALSGIFDPEPIISTSHNRILDLTTHQARALSVICPNDENLKLALVACGTGETQGFKKQTVRYAEAACQAGQNAQELWIEDRHHYNVVLEFANAESRLAKATRQMILHLD